MIWSYINHQRYWLIADGMVIVECAAFGVASITHHKDIGACELLGDSVFSTDMTSGEIAARDIRDVLKNRKLIERKGNAAKRISLGYNVKQFAVRLKDCILDTNRMW